MIHAPELCSSDLETNDVVRLHADGTFTIVGRADNVVNSGGVKIQIEEEERRLKEHILRVAAVPVAGNGKIDRKACRELALEAGAIR